ncbi:WD40 repeat-like protein [Schizopora paradoxa]|uniref:Ribosome biogenesis protein YTM1 n=1 Tax=Schizopora paradoxa TaxID=27342 RepID=A0A0H2S1A8_9AGAM|nr:WD40 repeat-like protein [Schizopora paradoxa]
MQSDYVSTLPVLFTTQTPHVLPPQKFMIPAAWKRYQLSQLVNKALSLETPIPFDFIVKGDILRTSLEEWCSANGVGTEETLELEYVESLMPPSHLSSIPHDDWVSSVSCRIDGRFVTGSYDGQVRLFDSSQKLVHSFSAHEAPLTSMKVLQRGQDDVVIATASQDTTARLTSLSYSSSPSSKTLASLHLHTNTISSISASSSGTHLLTGSWDSLIGIWDTSIPEADQVPTDDRKKRRKVNENGDAPRRKGPVGIMKGHTGRITSVEFSDDDKYAFSAGLDSSIRCWDVENEICIGSVIASTKPFLSILVPQHPHTLLASSTDRTVTMYDTRQLRAPSSTATTYTTSSLSHPATPSALAASPKNSYHVASGAYDGVVRIWDLRSTRDSIAVATFKVPEVGANGEPRKGDGKILALDWAKNGLLAVGGESGLDIWNVPE